MSDDLLSWLKLATLPKLKGRQIRRLLSHASPQQLLQASEDELLQLGLELAQCQAIKHPNNALIDQCLSWASLPNRYIIPLYDKGYPPLLKEITNPPLMLFVHGNAQCLTLPQVAIVGSRHASRDGLTFAEQLGADLVANDLVVTSGLALGIDGKAHRGALNGNGLTAAVLGCGLNRIYPARHKQLANDIVESGCLVSEFWPDTPPRAEFFPRRNRIISGLSAGVIVVEAAERSGSLITARYAVEQNRDVFAVPGSVFNPHSKGCHQLIKQGAKLIESVSDVLDEIDTLRTYAFTHQPDMLQAQDLQEELPFPQLLANVGSEARCVDVLAEVCDQPVHEIMMQLLELELRGLVSAVPGGYVRTRRG